MAIEEVVNRTSLVSAKPDPMLGTEDVPHLEGGYRAG